jgi:hypothetical protein
MGRIITSRVLLYGCNNPHDRQCPCMASPRLLDQIRITARLKHFSIRTEKAYVRWARRFILFHHKRHPSEMAEPQIRQFLGHLAVDRKVSASTQTVAPSALLFLYREVLKLNLPNIDQIERARPHKHLPVVFSRTRSAISSPTSRELTSCLQTFFTAASAFRKHFACALRTSFPAKSDHYPRRQRWPRSGSCCYKCLMELVEPRGIEPLTS